MATEPMFDSDLMTPEDLARRVRQLRDETGLTQEEFGERVNYASSTISKAENYREGDGMVGTRIAIIEAYTDAEIEGPFYREVD